MALSSQDPPCQMVPAVITEEIGTVHHKREDVGTLRHPQHSSDNSRKHNPRWSRFIKVLKTQKYLSKSISSWQANLATLNNNTNDCNELGSLEISTKISTVIRNKY